MLERAIYFREITIGHAIFVKHSNTFILVWLIVQYIQQLIERLKAYSNIERFESAPTLW